MSTQYQIDQRLFNCAPYLPAHGILTREALLVGERYMTATAPPQLVHSSSTNKGQLRAQSLRYAAVLAGAAACVERCNWRKACTRSTAVVKVNLPTDNARLALPDDRAPPKRAIAAVMRQARTHVAQCFFGA